MPTPDDTRPADQQGPSELVTLFAFEAASRLRWLAPRIHLTESQRDCMAVTEAVCATIANGGRA